MLNCPKCRAGLAEAARFCSACGHERAVAESGTRTELAPQPAFPAPAGSRQHERYVPGTVVAGRYRIVGLLGRGGMGEVYRADDLKLGQPVALKFLPLALAQDAGRLERLYNEVRLARQVSHPNICRVYDIGEAPVPGAGEVHHFMTMEYVDGEDLASLLRRIGRLPEDKAVQIARQICVGLAAAHDQGVLHRDLKPANIMIDGRGQARVTDFGIAALAGEIDPSEIRAGTPMYMAPEQLAGREVTIQSDLYALGLLLYETFTGKPAFDASTLQEAIQQRTGGTPTNPSSHVSGLDPLIELVILRCLRPEPHERPAGALAVAAALPGGDPLAAALAAGETPSPQMVAAAATEGALSPGVAWGGAALSVVLAVLLLFLHSVTRIPVTGKSPAALQDRAIGTLESLGYTADHTLASIDNLGPAASPYRFWLRSGPSPLAPRGLEPSLDDPPFTEPAMISLVTDTEGRLRRFEATPEPMAARAKANGAAEPDWTTAFAAAGLDPRDFADTPPLLRPRHDVDRRVAWAPTQPDALRVDAGSRDGKIAWFEVSSAADPEPADDPGEEERRTVFFVLLALFFAGILIAGIVLARRNLASGRGDRRGAWRIACVVAACDALASLCLMAHTVSFRELAGLVTIVSYGLFTGAVVWLLYIAIEPEIRNRWPHRIVSWTRALDGRFRDPLVGRHILIGTLGGLMQPALALGAQALEIHARGTLDAESFQHASRAVIGLRGVIGATLAAASFGTELALGIAVIWVGMFLVLRREGLAAVGVGAVLFLGLFIQMPQALMALGLGLFVLLLLILMLRYGLLSLVVGMGVFHLWIFYPVSGSPDVWYAGNSALIAAAAVAPAFYGAWAASRGPWIRS